MIRSLIFPELGRRQKSYARLLCSVLIVSMACVAQLSAQAPETGAIEGRVLNAETGRFVANAEVTIEGTGLRRVTDDFGEYRFPRVPAGEIRVRASYIGRDPILRTVNVVPGETIRQDFTFYQRRGEPAVDEEEGFELADFEVTSRGYESAAEIAIAEERMSANIKNVVSSEAFGDVPEGNIAEFVKFIPGVLIGYGGDYTSGADATQISVRGFPPHQTSVMIDGVPIANAQPGSLSRATGLDMLSINNASRVEVTKVPTPDMPNDSIGGSINLISKSAFEYAEPFLEWRTYLSVNSEHTDIFERTPGPANERTFKALPGFDMTYALPVNDRFGVTVTLASSNQFNQNHEADIVWHREANRRVQHPDGHFADMRYPWLEDIEVRDRPRNSHRHSGSIKLDYMPWDGHTITANYQVSIYDSTEAQRIVVFKPGRDPEDWGPDFVVGGVGDATGEQIVRGLDKEGITHSGYLRWSYIKGPWDAKVHVSHSISDSALVSTENGHFSELEFGMEGESQINFGEIRDGIPTPESVQVLDAEGNPIDYTLLENYSPSELYARAGQTDTEEEITVYKADIRRDLDFIPTDRFSLAAKVGVYREENIVTKSGRGVNYRYRYIGAPDTFDPSIYRDTVYSGVEHSFGYPAIEWADLTKTYNHFQDNPGQWSDTDDYATFEQAEAQDGEVSVAANNWIEHVNDNKQIKEVNDAYYAQLEGEFFNHRLTILGGIRYEKSSRSGYGPERQNGWEVLKNPDGTVFIPESTRHFPNGVPRTSLAAFEEPQYADLRAELQAAGIEWDHPVIPGSLEAAQLEWLEKRPINEVSNGRPAYSVHTAYDITDRLVARISYANTFGQVDYEDQDRGGILARTEYVPNEVGPGGIISVGNADLEPWIADNWDFSLSYYTDTGGKFAISYFLKDVENFHLEEVIGLTEENYEEEMTKLGLTPAARYGRERWDIYTTVNGEGTARTDGWEFEASQTLGIIDFLGEWGDRFYIFGSYTMKEYSANQDASGALGATSDDFAAGGISYQGPRLGTRINFTYRDESITDTLTYNLLDESGSVIRDENGEDLEAVIFEYEPSEVKVDINVSYRFYENYEFFVNARNVTNTRTLKKRKSLDDLYPEYAATYEANDYGVQYTIGIRGSF